MKRTYLIRLLLLLAGLVLLTACGGGGTVAETGASTDTPTVPDASITPESDTPTTAESDTPTTAESDAPTETEAPAPPETETEDDIIARFAVFSDAHIGKTNVKPSPESKLESALEQLAAVLPGYDAVFFAGDMTDHGTDAEYMEFLRIWNEKKLSDATLGAPLGNHEFFRDGVVRYGGESPEFLKECRDAYAKYFGSLNNDFVVGGVHIITISADNSAAAYQSSEAYLIEHVEAAAAEDPTMPIVIIAHEGAGLLHDSGSGNYTQATLNCLKKYPQIIFFSGHTHFSLYDPRMIRQRDYTNIQTSTVGADLWNYNSIDPDQPVGKDNVSEGHLVTVDKNGLVTVTRYDFFRQTTIGQAWVIDIPAVVESKKNFTYTDALKNDAAAPAFPDGATVTVSDVTASGATVTFPAASVSDEVSDGQIYLYRITVTEEGQSKAFYKYDMPGEYYLGGDASASYTHKFNALLGGTAYTVTVTAETPWGKTASVTSAAFTTEAAPEVDDSDARVLLHADYTKGSYEDMSPSGLACELFGAPKLEEGVALLDKQSAYAYRMTEDIYKQIPDKLSLEFSIYIEPDQTYPWGYVTLVGNTEAGGFGVSYLNTGVMKFEVNIGGAYQSVTAKPAVGEWMHVLATYDGQSMKLYFDGTLAASGACSGNIKHVAPVSRKLVVGADVNGEGNIQTISNIRVGFVRLWDKGLSAKTAAELAAAAKP